MSHVRLLNFNRDRKGEIGISEAPISGNGYLYKIQFRDGNASYYFEDEIKKGDA